MAAGLITAIHYAGTPKKLASMGPAMMGGGMVERSHVHRAPLTFGTTALLGAFAGLTIFLGLPLARMRTLSSGVIAALNALAIGILVYLTVEIANNATGAIMRDLAAWRQGAPFPGWMSIAFPLGFLAGVMGLGVGVGKLTRRGLREAEQPLALAAIIAFGIGAHNFAEGLAIGASAASGATTVAVGLIVGFALHNATEGFGVVAPLVGRVMPTWGQLGLAGLIAGGPTFLGTVIGYHFHAPVISVLFLGIAVGALVFVIGELWSVLRRVGITVTASGMITLGFLLAFVSEVVSDLGF